MKYIQHCLPAFNFKTFWQEGNQFHIRHSLRYFNEGPVRFVWYTESIINHMPTKKDVEKLEEHEKNRARQYIKSKIDEAYKESKQILINGKPFWFNSEQRAALINSIDSEYADGKTQTNIIINNINYNLDIGSAKQLITKIEDFSKVNFFRKYD